MSAIVDYVAKNCFKFIIRMTPDLFDRVIRSNEMIPHEFTLDHLCNEIDMARNRLDNNLVGFEGAVGAPGFGFMAPHASMVELEEDIRRLFCMCDNLYHRLQAIIDGREHIDMVSDPSNGTHALVRAVQVLLRAVVVYKANA